MASLFWRVFADTRGVTAELLLHRQVNGIRPLSFLIMALMLHFVGDMAVNMTRPVHWSVSLGYDVWEEDTCLQTLFGYDGKEASRAEWREFFRPGSSSLSKKIEATVGSQKAEAVVRFLESEGEQEAADSLRYYAEDDRKTDYLIALSFLFLLPVSAWFDAFFSVRFGSSNGSITTGDMLGPMLLLTGFAEIVTAPTGWVLAFFPGYEAMAYGCRIVDLFASIVMIRQFHLVMVEAFATRFLRNFLCMITATLVTALLSVIVFLVMLITFYGVEMA